MRHESELAERLKDVCSILSANIPEPLSSRMTMKDHYRPLERVLAPISAAGFRAFWASITCDEPVTVMLYPLRSDDGSSHCTRLVRHRVKVVVHLSCEAPRPLKRMPLAPDKAINESMRRIPDTCHNIEKAWTPGVWST